MTKLTCRKRLVGRGSVTILMVLVIIGPRMLSAANTITAANTACYALLALGLCVAFSYLGYPSLGQAFVATSAAYGYAIFTHSLGVSTALAGLMAIIVGVLAASIIGLIAVRTAGFYFAVATLMLGELAGTVASDQLVSLTGGPQGMAVPYLSFGAFTVNNLSVRYYLAWALVIGFASFLLNLERSRVVRRAKALRSGGELARIWGINPYRLRVPLLAVSGVIIGAGGVILSSSVAYMGPDEFDINLTILVFIGLLLGGRRGVWGALIGSVVISLLSYIFESLGSLTTLGYGVVLLIVIRFVPGGLTELVEMTGWIKGQRLPTLSKAGCSWMDVARSSRSVQRAGTAGPALRVEGLEVQLEGYLAIRNVSFTLCRGEVLALMGPNGAGKSTVINALSGTVPTTRGRILLGEEDISNLPAERRRRAGLSRTVQAPVLADDLKVWENIAAGGDFASRVGLIASGFTLRKSRQEEREANQRARSLAELVGLGAVVDSWTNTLSYGQRRLVDIARCVAGPAEVILLDEPMAGLSPEMARSVAEIIGALKAAGYSLIVVEHNLDSLNDIADRAVFLVDGQIEVSGSVEEVLKDQNVVAKYIGVAS